MFHLLKKQSLGKQYGFIFTLVILLFTVSVMVTYLLLDDTNQSIDETEETNAIVVEVNKWMSLYKEKYMSIPEYIIIEESDQRLFDFLLLSSNFVNQVEHLKSLLSDDKIIKSRHIKKEELDFNSSKKVLARNHGLRLFSLNNRISL